MIDEANVNNIATIIFEGIKWEVSDEEIKQLSNNILALERRGLSQLNKRLTEGGKKIWDTIAEHNFGYELIEHHPHNIPILYEPNEFEGRTLRRPPDFVIQKNGITFWIQMKKLSRTERENRQSNAVKRTGWCQALNFFNLLFALPVSQWTMNHPVNIHTKVADIG